MQAEKFSVRSRLKSFYYAGQGLVQFFRREHNAWIHMAATIAVTILSWWLKISHGEILALVLAIGLVWVTEILNTCVEKIADMITQEIHPQIKVIKDMAAGAVLVAAIIAVIIGSFIFIPKFL